MDCYYISNSTFVWRTKKFLKLMKGLGQGMKEFKKAKDEPNQDKKENKEDSK